MPNHRFLEVKLAKPVTLTCDIEGRPTPNYPWSSNSSDLTNFSYDTLTYSRDADLGHVVEMIGCSANVEGVGEYLHPAQLLRKALQPRQEYVLYLVSFIAIVPTLVIV